MVFTFTSHTTADREALVDTLSKYLNGEGLAVEVREEELEFHTGSIFSRLNFDPFQMVSHGTITWRNAGTGGQNIEYKVNVTPVWLLLPVYFIVWLVVQWSAGFILPAFLLCVIYLQQRSMFNSWVRRFERRSA